MPTKEDFKRPPHDSVGDATARDVFASVGYALSQWEHLETGLASLYSFLCSPRGATHASFRSYGTLTSVSPRRQIIRAAADVFFLHFPNQDLSDQLSSLLGIYGDASGRRNEIAHGTVMGHDELRRTPANTIERVKTHWFLFPALHNTNKNTVLMEREYAFSTSTIDKFAKLFDGLSADFIEYRKQIVAFYEGQPEAKRAQY